MNVARQHRRQRGAIDDDRRVCCAGHLDVLETGLRTSNQDTGAERRRGIADDPKARKFRTGHSGGDDGGAAFRRGAG